MKILAFFSGNSEFASRFCSSYLKQYHPEFKCKTVLLSSVVKDIAFQLFGWSGLQAEMYYENNPNSAFDILPTINLTPNEIWELTQIHIKNISFLTLIELAINNVDCDLLIISDLQCSETAYILKYKYMANLVDLSSGTSLKKLNTDCQNLMKTYVQKDDK